MDLTFQMDDVPALFVAREMKQKLRRIFLMDTLY